jgi:uncharacterized membrane protein YbhN (UPF0104 family)
MWDHESQRIGKQLCTPIGYALHGIAEWIGLVGLLLLLLAPVVVGYQLALESFRSTQLWLFGIAFGMGIISEVMFQFSWWLAARRGYHYDYERCEASWWEAGERRTYKYPA